MAGRGNCLDAQIVAVVLAIVGDEVHQRECQRLVLDGRQRIGNRIGPLSGWKHVEDDGPAIVRDAALFVDRRVADRDRPVEVLRCGEVDLLARRADADAIGPAVRQREAAIDNHIGEDREARQAAIIAGDVEAYAQCTDIGRRRGAVERKRSLVEGKPVW